MPATCRANPLWLVAARAVLVMPAPSQREKAARIVAHFKRQAAPTRSRLAARIAPRPTTAQPFVFFHQRKAAGSSMRWVIVQAARKFNATYFVPCYNGTPCLTFAPPSDGRATQTLFAAHFYWPAVGRALRMAQHPGAHYGADAQFSCFTNFREPVDRVTSCWYYRRLDTIAGPYDKAIVGSHKSLSSLPLEEFRALLAGGMSKYNEGCNNEPLRILSDSGQAEEKINTLTSGVSGARVRVNQRPTVKLYFRAQSDVTHSRTRICCATRTAGRSTRRGRSRELFLT